MTNREDVFETWVPPDSIWSLWARPVLFAQMSDLSPPPAERPIPLSIDLAWTRFLGEGTVVVVDLPGAESVRMGLALTTCGYRPVPLFNACTGPNEAITQGPIIDSLRAGAAELAARTLPPDAPPAFLLDSRRMGSQLPVAPGVFDNRWKAFPQDFPSASFLTERGYRNVVLVQHGREPEEDLVHVLRRWQDAGLVLRAQDLNRNAAPEPIDIARPAWYRLAWQRTLAMFGLQRASGGGFGATVREASHG